MFGEALSRPLHITVSEIIVTLLLGRIVLCPDNRIAAVLRSRLLRYVGTISYSLYLWQELFVTADRPSWGSIRTMPLALVVPLAIAIASYHLMERPILQTKRKAGSTNITANSLAEPSCIRAMKGRVQARFFSLIRRFCAGLYAI